jgi:hypothetical protein
VDNGGTYVMRKNCDLHASHRIVGVFKLRIC